MRRISCRTHRLGGRRLRGELDGQERRRRETRAGLDRRDLRLRHSRTPHAPERAAVHDRRTSRAPSRSGRNETYKAASRSNSAPRRRAATSRGHDDCRTPASPRTSRGSTTTHRRRRRSCPASTPIWGDRCRTLERDLAPASRPTSATPSTNTGRGSHVGRGRSTGSDYVWIAPTRVRPEPYRRSVALLPRAYDHAAPAAAGRQLQREHKAPLPRGIGGTTLHPRLLDAHNWNVPPYPELHPGPGPALTPAGACRISSAALRGPAQQPWHASRSPVTYGSPICAITDLDVPPTAGSRRKGGRPLHRDQQRHPARRERNGGSTGSSSRFDASLDGADALLGEPHPVGRSRQSAMSYTGDRHAALPEGVTGDFHLLGYADSARRREQGGVVSNIGFNLPGVTLRAPIRSGDGTPVPPAR